MRHNFLVKVTRYAVVGAVTLAVYLVVGALLQVTGATVVWLAPVAFAVAVAVNYILQRVWVFADPRPVGASLPKYTLMVAVGGAVNSYVLIALAPRMPLLWAQLLAATLVVLSNALFSFLWTFRTQRIGNLRH